jgi:C1A family cysteine protease
MNRKYPLKRQPADDRDALYAAPEAAVALPDKVDLRDKCPPVFDQGSLGSCTANAGVAAYMMLAGAEKEHSRLYQYYMERYIEGTTAEDAGAYMRDIGKSLNKYGVCTESRWPYIESKFAADPPEDADTEAAGYKVSAYRSVSGISGIKRQLAAGTPVMIGIEVYPSFEAVGSDGIVPMPGAKEDCLGGHAVLAVGYDDNFKKQKSGCLLSLLSAIFGASSDSGYLIVRNSWGKGWGDGGYFYLPYSYLDKHGYDFWILEA